MTGPDPSDAARQPTGRAWLATTALLVAVTACDPPDPGPAGRTDVEYLRIVAAEDARPDSGPELERLLTSLASPSPLLRRAAVRSLGRLERPEHVDAISALLDDPDAGVRAEVANALAQAVHRTDGDAVARLLIAHVEGERDPAARASLARSIGRAASSPAVRAQAGAALLGLSRLDGADAPLHTLVGVTVGFESLVRGAEGRGLGGAEAARLTELADPARLPPGLEATRVRTVASMVLGQARRLDGRLMARLVDDPEPAVRHVGTRYFDGVPPARHDELLGHLLADTAQVVRVGALQLVASGARTEAGCEALLDAAGPAQRPPVRVVAIEGLARACPQRRAQRDLLRASVAELTDPSLPWQPAAQALIASTSIDPEGASEALPTFTAHEDAFVRAHAARAAGALGDREALDALLEDPHPNVRTAAIQSLFALDGRGADAALLSHLSSDDPQLLLTVARLLEGSAAGEPTAVALLETLDRISQARRETWRDPRVELLRRVGQLGDASLEGRLTPYLSDYDPAVATLAAEVIGAWSRRVVEPSPVSPIRRPPPTPSRYRALRDAVARLHMASGDTIVIQLDAYGATMSVDRFVRLAEEGYFDGLTFHRWAPNFVIQGGSPSANEYQGAGPFARDELGLPPHWRGTVGISTRGRDTGDAQIFVNLIDNVRLDHDYTIIGEVVAGMDAVDRVLEGSVIERVEIVRGG